MESGILHETANLYLFRVRAGQLEIRLNGATSAVVVGTSADEAAARRTMEKLERYPAALRRATNH